MNERTAKGRSRDVRAFVSLASRETKWEKMQALCNAMCRRFKGIAGLSKVWVEEMKLAKQHPDSPVRARCLLAYFNMLMMVEQNKPPEPSLNQISNEELSMRIVADLMKEWPEMVVAIGEALGWTLSPPSPEPESQDSIDPVAEVAHS